jgi:hypothetical protein
LTTGHRLATTLAALDRLDDAQEVLEAIVAGRRDALGDEHPDTQAAIKDLEALRERRTGDTAA